jgi:hypothetical protein
MLRTVDAIEFNGAISTGRTSPCRVTCEADDGSLIEAAVKFSAGCDRREVNLALEVIAACLAGDLDLPIPEPLLVRWSREWADCIPDQTRRTLIQASAPVAFGSTLVLPGFRAWHRGARITDAMLPVAAAIFAFDALISNPDRREGNPNCLVKGNAIRIFDHEMALQHKLILNWIPPWRLGGLRELERPGAHIFLTGLKGRERLNLDQVQARWSALPDRRLREYETALPIDWSAASGAVGDATTLVAQARDNIDGCLSEVRRVLS